MKIDFQIIIVLIIVAAAIYYVYKKISSSLKSKECGGKCGGCSTIVDIQKSE